MSHLIVAIDEKGGIGLNNDIPWKGTEHADLRRFRRMTKGGAVIMGYNTFCSIGGPLVDRTNIIVTRGHKEDARLAGHENLVVFDNLDSAVRYGQQFENRTGAKCFIIGGAQIYAEYLRWFTPQEMHVTEVPGDWGCDVHIRVPDLRSYTSWYTWTEVEPGYTVYKHGNKEEECYLDLFRYLLERGTPKTDRTLVGTRSYFSPPNLEFSLLGNTLPVLTTKTVLMKSGVVPELLWFISGSTDTKVLEAKGCNIWKGNTSREFLDSRGLGHYAVGELGPGYGFQWRHAGEPYQGADVEYGGYDQLQSIVDLLRQDPDSRRILMVSWAPAQIDQMALPPCHVLYQVYTELRDDGDGDGVQRYLSAKMYQRSADSFLGVPFNIASYAILTHILAKLTGMKADRLIMTYGDYHIYNTHVDAVREQLQRSPRPFPKIRFTRDLKGTNIDDVREADFEIVGYNPHPKITAPMAV